MPEIFLKPKSASFADSQSHSCTHVCDMPGCFETGGHRAPKDRSLSDYYNFCFEHAGDRPTWKYGVNGNAEDALYQQAWKMKFGEDAEPPPNKEDRQKQSIGESQHSKEYEAMAIMGLEPPLTFDAIKLKYRELALKHHPDRNQGCLKSEELLKTINMAYTVLKLAYEKFDKLPNKD